MLVTASACLATPGVAFAQKAPAPGEAATAPPAAPKPAEASSTEDVITITARKRVETLIDAPVTVTAVGATELKLRGISNVDSLARIVPGLISGEGGGAGGIVTIRGISGADNNPFGDQAVSFNIDGVGIGRAHVRRMSEFDVQQIEVLKGPQALFFGKNSPAGIISVRTADPTDHFEAQIHAGYEIYARELRTEGYISGPLGSGFGFRAAGQVSNMQGWAKSYVPRQVPAGLENNIHPPTHSRTPNGTDFAGRLTLKYDDGGPFTAKLKMSYAEIDGDSFVSNTQYVNCPLGFPQASPPAALGLPIDDCKADDRVGSGDFSPNLRAFDPVYPADGHTYLHQRQALGSLEMNYQLLDHLTLTSQTGYYKVHQDNVGNFTENYYEDNSVFSLPAVPVTGPPALNVPRQLLSSRNVQDVREITEEGRLTSNFDFPLNVMVGGLYQDSRAEVDVVSTRRTFNPIWINKSAYRQEGKAWSLFGQGTLRPLEGFELSGGVRYSHENKKLPVISSAVFPPTTNTVLAPGASPSQLVPITNPNLIRDVTFTNWSPEFTLSYKPTRDMNVYASYKQGFLSGGFSALAPTIGIAYGGTPAGCIPTGTPPVCVPYPVQQVIYNQQITKGFEIGFKAALFDRRVRFTIAAYNYKTNGLQVGTTIGLQQEIRNAASVRTKGIEGDINYRTPVNGLFLNGALAYNKGTYLDYQASCYRGQSSATCFNQVNRLTGTTGLLQDLSGKPLVRAPKWTGNGGFNYETRISDGLKLGLLGSMNYSSKYFTDTLDAPGGLQHGYALFDATVRIADADDRWEAAVIGRNLTNKYYFVRSVDTPFTGTAPGAAPVGILADTGAPVNRGREIMMRLSYKLGHR
jgi:iron complex outermembrane receptor protein